MLPLDLFGSLACYLRTSSYAAQSIGERTIPTAPDQSYAQSQAALLSALEFYAHRPLRRADIHAALARLERISPYAASTAGIESEVMFWRAEGLRALDQFGPAEIAYQSAIAAATDPKARGITLFRLAELQERDDKLSEADSNFGRAAAIPQSPLVLLSLLRQAAVERRNGHLATALDNLDRADSIYRVTVHTPQSFDRDLAYRSALIGQMMLERTSHDRIISSSPPANTIDGYAVQVASPFYRCEVALVRGSTLSGLGRYDESASVLRRAEESIDSIRQFVDGNHDEARFVANALRFERAWSLFERMKFKEAASAFLELAVTDTGTDRQTLLRVATSSLRERGEFYDPFVNDSLTLGTGAAIARTSLEGSVLDTSSFFYNDFPERARYYAGVALARAGMTGEASDMLQKLAQNKAMLYSDLASYQLALIRFGQHGYEAANLLESTSSEQNVRGAYASLLLGELSYRRGMYERADAYFLNSYANLPLKDTTARATAHLERGLSLIPLGAWHEAADEIHTYLRLSHEKMLGRTDEALFWLGRAYLRDGQYDSALTTYSTLLADFPKSARGIDAQYGYAWSLFEVNDFSRADTAFQSIVAMDSISRFSYDALARAGDSYYALGRDRDANRLYNLAVDRPAFNDLRTTRALLMLGVTRFRMDSARSAMNIFAYLAKRYPKSDLIAEAHFNRALAAYSINQTVEAEKDVQTILTQYHQSALAPRALFVEAEERNRREDLHGAISDYQQLLRDYPRSGEAGGALFALQTALLALKRGPEALAAADTFMQRYPESPLGPNVLLRSGEISLRLGESAHAKQLLESFRTRYPSHTLYPRAELLIARAALLGRDTTAALSQLALVIAKYDSLDIASEARLDRARMERKQNMLGQAAADFQSAYDLRYYSSDAAPLAMYEYSEMIADTKKPDSAIAVLRDLSHRYPIESSIAARGALRAGELLAAKRSYSEARIEFNRITEAHTNDVWGGAAAVRIGETYASEKNFKQAVTGLTGAKDNFPLSTESDARRLLLLGEAQLALGRKAAAAQSLRELLRIPGITARQRATADSLLSEIAPPKKAKKGRTR